MGIGQERKLMPHDALLRLRFPTGQGVASMTFFFFAASGIAELLDHAR